MERSPQTRKVRHEIAVDLEVLWGLGKRRLVPKPLDDGARGIVPAAAGVQSIGFFRESYPDVKVCVEPTLEIVAKLVRPTIDHLKDGCFIHGDHQPLLALDLPYRLHERRRCRADTRLDGADRFPASVHAQPV